MVFKKGGGVGWIGLGLRRGDCWQAIVWKPSRHTHRHQKAVAIRYPPARWHACATLAVCPGAASQVGCPDPMGLSVHTRCAVALLLAVGWPGAAAVACSRAVEAFAPEPQTAYPLVIAVFSGEDEGGYKARRGAGARPPVSRRRGVPAVRGLRDQTPSTLPTNLLIAHPQAVSQFWPTPHL